MIKISRYIDSSKIPLNATTDVKTDAEKKVNRVVFAKLDDQEYAVQAEKKIQLPGIFGRLISFILNFIYFSRRYVELEVEDSEGKLTQLMIHVNSFAKRIHASRKEVWQKAKEGHLDELIEKQLNRKQIKDEANRIREHYKLNEATQCYDLKEGSIPTEIQKDDLEEYIRAICLLRFPIQKMEAPTEENGVKIVQPHTINLRDRKIQVVVIPGETDQKIIGLFGKEIARGAIGRIIHTVDITTGQLTEPTNEMAVLKTAIDLKRRHTVTRAATYIKRLHQMAPGGKAVGIQDSQIIVKDIGCLSSKYEWSVADEIEDRNRGLKPILVKHATYQLAQALAHIHANNMVHKDVKVDNILFRKAVEDKNWEFHFGDFDSITEKGIIPPNCMTTASYMAPTDMTEHENAEKISDFPLMKKIAEKSEVFAFCTSVYLMALARFPYERDENLFPKFDKTAIRLKRDLTTSITESAFINLIVQGLSPDYKARPTAQDFVELLKNDRTIL